MCSPSISLMIQPNWATHKLTARLEKQLVFCFVFECHFMPLLVERWQHKSPAGGPEPGTLQFMVSALNPSAHRGTLNLCDFTEQPARDSKLGLTRNQNIKH